MASFFSRLTSVFTTPSTLLRAFLTVIGQAAHVMPGTDRVTVFVAAHADAPKARARVRAVISFFMKESLLLVSLQQKLIRPSIEQRQNVWESNRDQNECGHGPENDLVRFFDLRYGTDITRITSPHRTKDAAVSKKERD